MKLLFMIMVQWLRQKTNVCKVLGLNLPPTADLALLHVLWSCKWEGGYCWLVKPSSDTMFLPSGSINCGLVIQWSPEGYAGWNNQHNPSSIRRWDLNQQPLDREPYSLTTRQWLTNGRSRLQNNNNRPIQHLFTLNMA